MTKRVSNIKNNLIEEIKAIHSEKDLNDIVHYLKLIRLRNEYKGLFNEMRTSISVEELKKEQNFQGINRIELDKLVEEMDIQESFEELLTLLN